MQAVLKLCFKSAPETWLEWHENMKVIEQEQEQEQEKLKEQTGNKTTAGAGAGTGAVDGTARAAEIPHPGGSSSLPAAQGV
jgi:hypothetical protein